MKFISILLFFLLFISAGVSASQSNNLKLFLKIKSNVDSLIVLHKWSDWSAKNIPRIVKDKEKGISEFGMGCRSMERLSDQVDKIIVDINSFSIDLLPSINIDALDQRDLSKNRNYVVSKGEEIKVFSDVLFEINKIKDFLINQESKIDKSLINLVKMENYLLHPVLLTLGYSQVVDCYADLSFILKPKLEKSSELVSIKINEFKKIYRLQERNKLKEVDRFKELISKERAILEASLSEAKINYEKNYIDIMKKNKSILDSLKSKVVVIISSIKAAELDSEKNELRILGVERKISTLNKKISSLNSQIVPYSMCPNKSPFSECTHVRIKKIWATKDERTKGAIKRLEFSKKGFLKTVGSIRKKNSNLSSYISNETIRLNEFNKKVTIKEKEIKELRLKFVDVLFNGYSVERIENFLVSNRNQKNSLKPG